MAWPSIVSFLYLWLCRQRLLAQQGLMDLMNVNCWPWLRQTLWKCYTNHATTIPNQQIHAGFGFSFYWLIRRPPLRGRQAAGQILWFCVLQVSSQDLQVTHSASTKQGARGCLKIHRISSPQRPSNNDICEKMGFAMPSWRKLSFKGGKCPDSDSKSIQRLTWKQTRNRN